MKNINVALKNHYQSLKGCNLCGEMTGPPVMGKLIHSSILLIGQAPGSREPELQKPFGWTAGRTLFKWFSSIGLSETDVRNLIYISAICRCFPGKSSASGDRIPNKDEINTCSQWLEFEIKLLKPKLIIPIGKLAISEFVSFDLLTDVVGKNMQKKCHGVCCDIIPLPHPSGLSSWHKSNPGKLLLEQALQLIKEHSAFKKILYKVKN